jgi:hypothetical protein
MPPLQVIDTVSGPITSDVAPTHDHSPHNPTAKASILMAKYITRNGSGVSREEVRKLAEELALLDRPVVRTTPPTFREVMQAKARDAFALAVDEMLSRGLTHKAIYGGYLHCDAKTLKDYLSGGRQVPAWVLHALPGYARAVYASAMLALAESESDKAPDSRTGTDG